MQLKKGLNRFFASAALAAGASGCFIKTDIDVSVEARVEFKVDCSTNEKKEVYLGDQVKVINDQYVVYKEGKEVGRSAPGANCDVSPSASVASP